MLVRIRGCFETSTRYGPSPCVRRHVRWPVAVPLRRRNRSILVMLFINSPVTSHTNHEPTEDIKNVTTNIKAGRLITDRETG